jgi:hypothetical protein
MACVKRGPRQTLLRTNGAFLRRGGTVPLGRGFQFVVLGKGVGEGGNRIKKQGGSFAVAKWRWRICANNRASISHNHGFLTWGLFCGIPFLPALALGGVCEGGPRGLCAGLALGDRVAAFAEPVEGFAQVFARRVGGVAGDEFREAFAVGAGDEHGRTALLTLSFRPIACFTLDYKSVGLAVFGECAQVSVATAERKFGPVDGAEAG